ncbi:SDR family NAD(P)-dependent oxidoreductase [Lacticaseibacillus baoqingensis]|uniref:SDR family NAD(P)-dependent oxidoreductase n=1 Tax=Lacticaseibacillus baoqingensis TaxID=2486013 RepID=A0ABW4E891_9LACO|nr:SDR family NAD(P)-dependent oxidoreductase [Lacticaseibacillus baoqingensis]
MQKTILITGASSGMGKAATILFAQHGWTVFAGARRTQLIPTGENIHPLALDVTDHASNSAFVAQAMTGQTRLDVLLNNAGYGEFGPLEEVPLKAARQQLETNLLGAADLTQLVLPLMRRQGFGRIINNSSIGGDMYSPLGGWYYVSKHALNVWSDTLDTEIRQFGLRSIVVEPGGTESNWSTIAMQHAQANLHPDSPYQALTTGFLTVFERFLGTSSATSADLAAVFYQAATAKRPHRRYFNACSDRLVARFARVHPEMFAQLMAWASRLALGVAKYARAK